MPDQQTCTEERAKSASAIMLTVDDVAALLACSPKTVYRLADQRRIPRPVRLGRLRRWPKPTFDKWIVDGCPASAS